MRFINTLETLRLYLMAKPSLTPQEKELLEKIREDLEYFPRGVLHRDDLPDYGYDSHLASCSDMATLASKIGEDCHEQMFSIQLPIIADANDIPVSECPGCGSYGEYDQDNEKWYCENHDCGLSWSRMKYIYIGYSKLTDWFLANGIGYPTLDVKETPMYIPVTEHRKYFTAEPSKDQFFHIMELHHPSFVTALKEFGYITERISDEKGIRDFGENSYFVSVIKYRED